MAGRVNLPLWLLIVLTVLATARLTHLITTDTVMDRPRAWLQSHAGDSIAYLVGCPWCLSMWLGAGVAGAVYCWPAAWFVVVPLLALTASYLTGIAEQVSALVNARTDLTEAILDSERADQQQSK